MKKLILLLWVFQCSIVYAQQLTPNDALNRVISFDSFHRFNVQHKLLRQVKDFNLCYTSKSENEDYFYVFNKGVDDGFIIVSADKRITPLIGFSNKGAFDPNHIPCGLKCLLEGYQEQIDYAIKHNISISNNASANSERADIEPMVKTTWDQGYPFNLLCPIDPTDGERSITGCTQVANAQLMYYHLWPDVGSGKNSYKWNNQTLSADFTKVHFEWDKMRLSYDNETSNEEKQAVATLMYYCGIADNADFSSWSTCGYVDTRRLHNYFNYKNQIQWLELKSTTLNAFESVIYNELQEKRPVLFLAEDEEVGHLMVIDGYESFGGLFHINLGWGGDCDGYYSLNIIDAFYHFDRNQSIFYNIEPDRDAPSKSWIYPQTSFKLTDDRSELVSWTGPETTIDMNNDVVFWNVNKIKTHAFQNDSAVESINFPGQLSIIEENAVEGCPFLETVFIPRSVEGIREGAFSMCRGMKNLIVDEENSHYNSDNGFLMDVDNKTLLSCVAVTGKLDIPEGVIKLGRLSLAGQQLSAVSLPVSLKTINQAAFKECTQLTSIILPVGVSYVGEEAFKGCSKLKSIAVQATTPPSVGANAFADIDISQTVLCVPQECMNSYRNASGWSQFTTVVGAPKTEAKKLVVYNTNGTFTEIMLSQQPFVKNKGSYIEISTTSTTISFELDKLQKMMFYNENDEVGAINDVYQDSPREVINFNQLPPDSKIEIYDIEGKLLKRQRVGNESQALQLSELGKGIFLVRINGITYKISIR